MSVIKDKKVKIATTLPEILNERLNDHCEGVDRNKNSIIRRALELYLDKEDTEAKNGRIRKVN